MTARNKSSFDSKDRGLLDVDVTATLDLESDGSDQGTIRDRFESIRKDHKPSIALGVESPLNPGDSDCLREVSQAVSRRAWIAFKDACDATDLDQRETSYLAARSALDELWSYAKSRDLPFRDLLGMLTAATKHTEFGTFTNTQRDVLRSAFSDLGRWLLDYDAVMAHIESFAEHEVDITGPLQKVSAKKLRITIEEVE